MPRSEARWRGLCDPAGALPQRHTPAPSQCAPKPLFPRRLHWAMSAVPAPVNFGGGGSRLPYPLLPTPHPRQALGPRLQSRLSSGLHFYCLSIPSFLLPLWKGVPGPQAWHLPFHREEKMGIWGPNDVLPTPVPPPGHPQPHTDFASNFSLPTEVVCVEAIGKSHLSAHNLIHISKCFF